MYAKCSGDCTAGGAKQTKPALVQVMHVRKSHNPRITGIFAPYNKWNGIVRRVLLLYGVNTSCLLTDVLVGMM